MDSENQQRILGYFIEEAKEHLETLEKGLLKLRAVVKDTETVNEMFRAAHSVKGGAAMLGFTSIQKTAHWLEDAFKVLKEHEVKVDRKLETLFLHGYDALKELIEYLQGPFGLREKDAEKTMQRAEPYFAQLHIYLEHLVSSGQDVAPEPAPAPVVEAAKPSGNLPPGVGVQVTGILKQMLQLFKQQDTPASRQKLQLLCKRLAQLGAGFEPWQKLVQIAYRAIANPKNSYPALAPIVLKELKQATDALQQANERAIAPSPALQKLAVAQPAITKAPSTPPQQITLTVEPKAATRELIQAFDKNQLSQLIKLLVQATRTP